MTPEDHAKVWKQAASVVAGMDPRRARMQAEMEHAARSGQTSWTSGFQYSSEQGAAWDSYSSAAAVLYRIAAEYEAEAKAQK